MGLPAILFHFQRLIFEHVQLSRIFFRHFFFSTNVKRTLTYQPYNDLLSVCYALVLFSFDFLFKRRFVCVSLHMNKRHSDARYMHRYMHATHSQNAEQVMQRFVKKSSALSVLELIFD